MEPSDELPYTADLDKVERFPINLVFWRVVKGDKILHRNPLFDATIGIVPSNLLVDLLHALLLGVIAQVSADLFWILMLNGIWGSRTRLTQEEWVHGGLIQMRRGFGNSVRWPGEEQAGVEIHQDTSRHAWHGRHSGETQTGIKGCRNQVFLSVLGG